MDQHTHPDTEKFTSGANEPFWIHSVLPISYSQLQLNKEVDVVIVGGGLAGVTIAYCLSKAGQKVALVEDGFIGSGETGRTTAHLVTALDDRYYEFERLFGEENSKLIANSHATAIDFVERIIDAEKIKCDFERVSGFLFSHPSDKADNLEKEFEAAKRAGLDVEKSSILLANKAVQPAIKFNNQAQFHPLKYLKGLCDAIIKNGGEIYTNTHANLIDHTGITTNERFEIKAKHVVIATNSPINNKYAIHLKQYPYRTYVVGFKIEKDSLPKALWWDTGDFNANENIPPYHYVRTQPLDDRYDLLIVGGEDHATGMADAEHKPEQSRYAILEKWAREHFDDLGDIAYRWSGQVMEPMDSLAFIGRNPMDKDNVYIVTGDSGNGMTHGTIAGLLIRDLITGKSNPWKDIYSPSRVKLFKAGSVFLKEFVGGYRNYLKTKDNDKKDESGISSIKKNEGGIVDIEGKKIGAYRDEEDNLHFIEAECTHLGCQVKWNNDEKSWDCPCHGSRFTYEGHVLNGPANKPLPYYSLHENLIKK